MIYGRSAASRAIPAATTAQVTTRGNHRRPGCALGPGLSPAERGANPVLMGGG